MGLLFYLPSATADGSDKAIIQLPIKEIKRGSESCGILRNPGNMVNDTDRAAGCQPADSAQDRRGQGLDSVLCSSSFTRAKTA